MAPMRTHTCHCRLGVRMMSQYCDPASSSYMLASQRRLIKVINDSWTESVSGSAAMRSDSSVDPHLPMLRITQRCVSAMSVGCDRSAPRGARAVPFKTLSNELDHRAHPQVRDCGMAVSNFRNEVG